MVALAAFQILCSFGCHTLPAFSCVPGSPFSTPLPYFLEPSPPGFSNWCSSLSCLHLSPLRSSSPALGLNKNLNCLLPPHGPWAQFLALSPHTDSLSTRPLCCASHAEVNTASSSARGTHHPSLSSPFKPHSTLVFLIEHVTYHTPKIALLPSFFLSLSSPSLAYSHSPWKFSPQVYLLQIFLTSVLNVCLPSIKYEP